MSKVKIQGNASGTGVVTLTAPNTNTDRTITLPDETVSLTGAPAGLDDVGGVARATSGLLFNGDTAAANALDDYEEGTWTPVFGGGMTYTLNATVAKYVKVGRLVSFAISLQWGSKSGGTGNVTISLPFATSSTSSSWQGNFTIGYSGGVTGIPKTGYNDSGQANFFMVPAAIGGGIVQTSAIGSAGHLIMGGSYQTD